MADGAPQAAVKKRMLRIASGCATREAFISVFRRFCDRDSIFIATRTPKEAGASLQFSITLADGAPLIGGTGTVLESWSDETSPYGRAGMRIRFDDLTPSGQALIDELVEARKAEEETRPGGVPVSAAAAALAALAKLGPATTSPRPVTPPIKPLPSVIPKAADHRKTMLGMTPLKRPARLEATPAPVAMPQVAARDVEVKLPPPPRPPARPTPDGDVTDDQTTGVAAKFTPDTAFPDEASWDEAANHVLGSTRAKGSDLVLPANPLGTVERESIDAFVECTIYEETGNFAVDDATAPGPAQPDDWREDDLTIPPWLQGPVADSPFAADSMAVPPPLLPLDARSSRPIEPPARPPTPPPDRRTSSELRARLVDAGKAFDPAKVPAAAPILKGDRRSHWPLTIAIAAATGLAGVAIGYFAVRASGSDEGGADQPAASESAPAEVASAGKPSQAPAPAAAAEPAPEQPAKPAPAEPPAGSDVIAQPEPPAAAAEESEPPPAAGETAAPAAAEPAIEFSRLTGKLKKDRCGAEIDSRPDEVDVFIGATRIGQTPLKVVLPCGEHAMELRRPRYQRLEKRIDLDQGKLDKVEVVMARPEHRLRITSVPGGAAVTVNGRAAGTTPATVTVNGFEQARISVALSGYKSWSTRVYVRDPTTSVSAKLAADKASTGKPAARPGKTSGSRAAESPARRGD